MRFLESIPASHLKLSRATAILGLSVMIACGASKTAPGAANLTRWAAFYGSAAQLGDLDRAARGFALLDVEADPDAAGFGPAQIAALKAHGARVLSYFNLGACEQYRSYWTRAPPGFVACGDNLKAQLGPYKGYPNETWMNPGDSDYQSLLVDFVAPRLLASGVDGFFFDNLEVVEHGPSDPAPCDRACAQGGLDLVYRLRTKYPQAYFLMQNASSDVTRLGTTHGVAYSSLIDGISHEEVYAPASDALAEQELLAWQGLRLTPSGRPFWISTEDYVGGCDNVGAASAVFGRSRARGFIPYATDASAGQKTLCYWNF